MAIFIKNIPKDTHLSDIYHFVAPCLQRYFPFKSGYITKTEIIAFLDKYANKAEYHGLVFVAPEDANQTVINKLNGKRFQSKLVIVKEYINRDWHNDRRISYDEISDGNFEKRVADRRRGQRLEVIKDISMAWE